MAGRRAWHARLPGPAAASGPAGQRPPDELAEALIQCLPGWLPDGWTDDTGAPAGP